MDNKVKKALNSNLLKRKDILKKLMNEYPDLEEAAYYYSRTVILLKSSKNEDIIEVIKILENLKNYDYALTHFQISKAYKKINNFVKAKEVLDSLEKSEDKITKYRALLEYANICFEEDNNEKAMKLYNNLLVDNNNDINKNECKLQIAKIYIKLGENGPAFKMLKSLLETRLRLNVIFELGQLESKLGNSNTALDYYQELVGTRFERYVAKDIKNLKTNLYNNELRKSIINNSKSDVLNSLEKSNLLPLEKNEIAIQAPIKEVKVINKKNKTNKNINIEKEYLVKNYISSKTKKELFELELYLYSNFNLDVNNGYIKLYDLLIGTLYSQIDTVNSKEIAEEKVKRYTLINEKININKNK